MHKLAWNSNTAVLLLEPCCNCKHTNNSVRELYVPSTLVSLTINSFHLPQESCILSWPLPIHDISVSFTWNAHVKVPIPLATKLPPQNIPSCPTMLSIYPQSYHFLCIQEHRKPQPTPVCQNLVSKLLSLPVAILGALQPEFLYNKLLLEG